MIKSSNYLHTMLVARLSNVGVKEQASPKI